MGERILQIESVDSLSWMKKHEAFLRDNKTWPLLAHAKYSFPGERRYQYQRVAWCDAISSISGVVRWRVRNSIWMKEVNLYSPPEQDRPNQWVAWWEGIILIKKLIWEWLPADILDLRIPIKWMPNEHILRRYFESCWQKMIQEWLIRKLDDYRDGIVFQLNRI